MDTDKLIFLIVIGITTLIIGAILATSFKKNSFSTTDNSESEQVNISVGQDGLPEYLENNPNVKGADDAVLTIIEFSDFQCPYCKGIVPSVEAVLLKYPNSVRVVFKQFPLTSIHKYAFAAAEASEAAAKQGKFWEYHDKLFDSQPNFKDEDLIKYAKEVGLDVEQFKTDMTSGDISSKVSKDMALGRKLKVRGTPTFFFAYGDKIEQVQLSSHYSLEDAVDAVMKKLDVKSSTQEAQ